MSNAVKKVGVVIVSYNASEAVRITLASVQRAKNRTEFKLILVDNASEDAEREKIRAAMTHHAAETGGGWRYIQQEKNLGFSGGNNIGISEFLNDEDISHICLLNSDVIVTDDWLDHLLEKRCDIISGVTNKADGEQCVPVDYQAAPNDCLDTQTETVSDKVYRRIADFANRWYEAWRGNLVESDVTFFCVLISRAAFEKIGLLDETFFPGGFEDDDYCIRARNAGYRIYLARDVFIHHWGSASFGQLQYEYFSSRARRNKEYLEGKHAIVWQRRPEKPFVSFAMDVALAVQSSENISLRGPFLESYVTNLTAMLDHFETEFSNLRNELSAGARAVPDVLAQQVAAAESYGSLRAFWASVVVRAKLLAAGNGCLGEDAGRLTEDLARITSGIHDKVECNFAIHAFLTTKDEATGAITATMPAPVSNALVFPARPTTRFGKLWWILRRGLRFLVEFDGIVFFGGYFYPERQSDGYFQRIQIIDRLFTDRWRVYVESDELRGRNVWFDRPEPNVLVLRIIGSKKLRLLVRLLALLAVLRCRSIYYHSVLRMYDNGFGQLLRLPGIKKAVDIHGVVPEEFRMHNDFYSAVLYDGQERLAVEKAGMVIVVTESMKRYLQQKFRNALKAKTVSFPMFPSVPPTLAPRSYVNGKPVVVYAGGLHKWQQIPKMIDAIVKTTDRYSHRFYCPEPQTVKEMLPQALLGIVTVEAKSHAELMGLYAECHYGFILREDIIVNRVACPTKLVEYLAMGIVPIVDCEDIGDFKSLGMQFIRIEDYLVGSLPTEEQRASMAVANFTVYECLKEVRQVGAREIYEFFTATKSNASASSSLMGHVRRLLAPNTWLGRSARAVWRVKQPLSGFVASSAKRSDLGLTNVAPEDAQAPLLECDILVQVDNFEAGGLENVVIDLNGTLAEAGYRVALLILGKSGPAVQRARDLGMTVMSRTYSDESYAVLLDQLKPKLVMAHYSIKGAAICKQRAIPFVQVIHNTYVWLNDVQCNEFARAAADTTAFVAVSEFAMSYSVSRFGVDKNRCVVIPNGIDFRPFDALDIRAARLRLRAHHSIGKDEFVFLDVGAINHQKNHLATLKAFNTAQKTSASIRMVILGPAYEPELLKELQAYIETHGLSRKVAYLGAVHGAHEYFAMADAFVSGTFFEGGPLTLLEAIRANLPVVMPNVGLATHFKDHSGFEIVEPVFNIECYQGSFCDMVSTLEFERSLAEAMIRTRQRPIRPGFSRDQLAALEKGHAYEKYRQLITDILAGKPVSANMAN